MNVRLRTCTEKSDFHWKGNPLGRVGAVLKTQPRMIAAAYYYEQAITFTDEILKELGIVGDLVIEKPGINKQKYKQWNKSERWDKMSDEERLREYHYHRKNGKHYRAKQKIQDSMKFSRAAMAYKNQHT